jgi:glycosyltransferase involved in cell wall biosynthesis
VLQRLLDSGREASLTILGEGPEHQSLIAKANSSGLGERVHLPGCVEDVERWLAAAHVYVHAAVYEPFGIAILEALATGLPVVTLDGGGNRDIVKDGVNGWLLPVPDAAAFAGRVLEVVSAPLVYSRMSAAATASAESFGIDGYADALIALYRGR